MNPAIAQGTIRDNRLIEPLPPRALVRLGTNGFATRDFLMDFAFSPDSSFIALAEANSPSRIVRIIETATGNETHKLSHDNGVRASVNCLAFSPDGRQILCGESDGTLAIWDWSAQLRLFEESFKPGSVSKVAWSPAGNVIAAATSDDGLVIRDARNPARPLHVLQPSKPRDPELGGFGARGVSHLSFTSDGRTLVSTSPAQEISIWNVAEGELERSFKPITPLPTSEFGASLSSVVLLPDDQTLLTGGFQDVKRETTPLKFGWADAQLPELKFWSVSTGQMVRELNCEGLYGWSSAAISPDGGEIAFLLYDEAVFRDARTGEIRRRISLPGQRLGRPAYSPDGKLLAIFLDNKLALYVAATGERLFFDATTAGHEVQDAAWSADGTRIATAARDGAVRVWNAADGRLLWHSQLAPVITPAGQLPVVSFVAFTPDGSRVVSVETADDMANWRRAVVSVFDAVTGEKLRSTVLKLREVYGAAVSPDDRTVIIAGENPGRSMHFCGIDLQSGETRFIFPPLEQRQAYDEAAAMQFLPGSNAFRVVTEDSQILEFHSTTGEPIAVTTIDPRPPVQRLANPQARASLFYADLNSDASRVLTSRNEFLTLWNAATGERELDIVQAHRHGARLAISADGKKLAAVDTQHTMGPGESFIRLYRDNGEALQQLDPGEFRAFVLRFSPDGNKLFTGFHAVAPLIWEVSGE